MSKSKTSNTVRKLQDTSWLAQTVQDKMDIESEKMGLYPSTRWNCLHALHIIINEADDLMNEKIYYSSCDGKRSIVISEIPSFVLQHGLDYDVDGMQCKLRGLAENYKNDDGSYIVSVLTTHDLNSAIIKDISELLYQMK